MATTSSSESPALTADETPFLLQLNLVTSAVSYKVVLGVLNTVLR